MGSAPLCSTEPRLRLVRAAERGNVPGPEDDELLIRDFEHGVSGAGGRLYDRLLPVVDATLYRVLGRREQDHADLVQSAFEQIVSSLSKRRFARGCSLASWATVLSCHVGLNALRSRRRERGVIDRDHDPSAPPDVRSGLSSHTRIDAELGAREKLAAIRHRLAEMDPDRVAAVLLHAMGHDLAEIATLTGTSVAAAQSRLSRGRRELRSRMEEETVRATGASSCENLP